MKLQPSQLLTNVLKTLAPITGTNLSNIKIGGEVITRELNLSFYIVNKVRKNLSDSNNPFPMVRINKIDSDFRNHIVLQDLGRRDNKRNLTLTKENDTFIFIQKKPIPPLKEAVLEDGTIVTNQVLINKFISEQEREGEWIEKYLKPINYSSVEQAEVTSSTISYNSYVEKEEVSIPVRSLDGLTPYKLTYLRTKKEFQSSSKFLYYVVESMEQLEGISFLEKGYDAKMRLLSALLDYTPVIVSKSREKYFQTGDHVRFTNTLFNQEVVQKESVLQEIQEIVNYNALSKLKNSQEVLNLIKYFPFLVPSKFSIDSIEKPVTRLKLHSSSFQELTYILNLKNVDYVKELWEHIEKLRNKYPVLKLINLKFFYYNPSLETTCIEQLKEILEGLGHKNS